MQRPDGTAKVVIRDGGTGSFIRNINFGSVHNPVALALLPDYDISGNPELAVLGDDGAGIRRVQVKDSVTVALVNIVDFP